MGGFLGGFFLRNFSGGIFWEKFFGGIFLGGFFWEDFWEDFLGGILCLHWNCFVKILVFVKILSESTRKEGGQNLDPQVS